MRWTKSLLLAALACQTALAGQAYEQLYRLYDYPRELNRAAVPVCFHHGCESVKRVRLSDEHWLKTRSTATPWQSSTESFCS